MKGIIFNLLEEVVRKDYGDETWEDLLEAAQVDGAYTSLGNYPDEAMIKLHPLPRPDEWPVKRRFERTPLEE